MYTDAHNPEEIYRHSTYAAPSARVTHWNNGRLINQLGAFSLLSWDKNVLVYLFIMGLLQCHTVLVI